MGEGRGEGVRAGGGGWFLFGHPFVHPFVRLFIHSYVHQSIGLEWPYTNFTREGWGRVVEFGYSCADRRGEGVRKGGGREGGALR